LPHIQNSLHHPFSCRVQEPISRAKYAYAIALLQPVLVKNYSVLISPHSTAKKMRLTVSVFPCTWEQSALISKSFRRHLHCDTSIAGHSLVSRSYATVWNSLLGHGPTRVLTTHFDRKNPHSPGGVSSLGSFCLPFMTFHDNEPPPGKQPQSFEKIEGFFGGVLLFTSGNQPKKNPSLGKAFLSINVVQ